MRDLSIVIPAAGLGRRMKSYGPKALIELRRGQTILGRQIAILRSHFPSADVVVVVGFEADRVLRTLPPDVISVENELHSVTNVARSLDLGLRACPARSVLIVYGDLVFTPETFACMPEGRSAAWVDTAGRIRDQEVGVNVQDGEVTHFSYGLGPKWAQIALLTGKELALFRKAASAPGRRRYFGFEVFNDVIDRGGSLLAHEPEGMHLVEVDTSRDIDPARLV